MCGIFGYVSNDLMKNCVNLRGFISQAIYVDALRGKDATGIFSVDSLSKTKITYYKRAVDGADFLRMNGTQNILKSAITSSIMVGHNRAATSGNNHAQNAHPFYHGHITGVHNGTLISRDGLKKPYDFEVDSESIIYNLSLSSPENIIPNLQGAFALVWYNSKEKMLHVVRNKERTLYFGVAGEGNKRSVLFASEIGMLEWLSDRNRIDLTDVQPFEVGTEYIFNPESPVEFKTIKHELYVPVVQSNFYRTSDYQSGKVKYFPLEKKEDSKSKPNKAEKNLVKGKVDSEKRYSFFVDGFTNYKNNNEKGVMTGWMSEEPYHKIMVHQVKKQDFDDLYKDSYLSATAITAKLVSSEFVVLMDFKTVSFIVDDSRTYIGPYNWQVGREEWEKLTKHGCSSCSVNLMIKDHKYVHWTQNGDPICSDCTEILENRL